MAEYKYKGYTFFTEEEYREAKKEAEAIEYLKNRSDLSDPATAAKLHDRLIERRMVTTPVGIDFLKELRAVIVKNGFITEDKLKPLPDIKKPAKKPKKKPPTKIQRLERAKALLRLVVFGLLVIIVGMFVIVLTGKSSPLRAVYEQQILDKYASWQEELDKKQAEINEKLYFLEQNGIYFEEEKGAGDGGTTEDTGSR